MAIDVLAKSLPGKIYNLSAGDPNLPVCEALQRAYAAAELAATHNYGSSQGNAGLRAKLWKNPDEVIIANGAKQLIYMSLAAVTKPGDEVVLIGPCWTSYRKICDILGLRVKLLTGTEEAAYCPELAQLAAAATPETAAIVVNNPNNPTGVKYDRAYMDGVLEIARRNNCYLISDEVYRYLFDGDFASFRGEPDVITIDGFSKCLNITGWRLGYAIAAPEIIEAMTGLQSQMSGPPGTLLQNILLTAWDGLIFTDASAYKDRMDLLCQIEKFRAHRPDGGFYFYLPIAAKWKDTAELCTYLLEKHGIAITPGDDYGVPRTVRISAAATDTDELREILEPLQEI